MSSFYDLASLVMIPSGKKAGKVYSQKPLTTDGQLDFTRASTATRIGSDGNIEKTRNNNLVYSNDFSNAAWTKSASSITANALTSPDGTLNASKLIEDSSNSTHRISDTIVVSGSGIVYTQSIFAKSGGSGRYLRIFRGSGTYNFAVFDLENGTVFAEGGSNIISTKIENKGNGWYRCSLTYTTQFSNIGTYYGLQNGSSDSYTGDGSSFIYIYGAQLEQGLVATDYIDTTSAAVSVGSVDNMPRLNYTFNSATSCPSLLLEPQRTNLETKSEYFEGWSLVSNVTRTTNYATSPEGTQNASRLQFTANGFLGNTTLSSGTEYTLSCYAKRNDSGSQSFGFFKDGSGAVDSEMALTSNWQRFTYTYTAGNSSFAGLAASSGADVSVFGYQIEAANFESSYIPTFGATVTRVADVCSKTGISGLFGQTEGTLFVDTNFNGANISTSQVSMFIRQSGSNNSYVFINFYQGKLNCALRVGGVTMFDSFQSGVLTEGRYKIGFAYKSGDTVIYMNGSQMATDVDTFGTTNYADVNVGCSSSGVNNLGDNLNQALVFKTRLTNDQLAELTSLDS